MRTPGLLFYLILIMALTILDALFSLKIMERGLDIGMNPLMRVSISAGKYYFVFAKTALTFIMVSVLCIFHEEKILVCRKLHTVGDLLPPVMVLYMGVVAYEIVMLIWL